MCGETPYDSQREAPLVAVAYLWGLLAFLLDTGVGFKGTHKWVDRVARAYGELPLCARVPTFFSRLSFRVRMRQSRLFLL